MLILMPVLMGGSGLAMYLLQGQVDTKDKRVVIVDHAGMAKDMILKAAEQRNEAAVFDKETGKKVQPAYVFEFAEPNDSDPQTQRLEFSERIRKGEIHAFLEIGPNVLHPKGEQSTFQIKYHAKNAAIDNVRAWLDNTINHFLRRIRLSEEGIEGPTADEIMTWIRVEPMGLVSVDQETGAIKEARRTGEAEAILVPVVLFFLMFMLVMMGAMPLLQSTMEEKTQRIAEVLMGSLQPHQFMTGKVVGGLLVSLTGALVYVAGGVFFMGRLGFTDMIPFHVIPWFFAFLILEIVMVGSILAAVGSACNDPKDAQNLTFPAMIPVFLPMFVFMPVLTEPTSAFATWLSLFPLFTPMLMLIRTASPVGIPVWQLWVGLAEVLLFTVFIVWIGGRIFRVGILMQGGPPKLSNMIKWAFRG